MSKIYEQLEPVIHALDERIKTNSSAFPTDTAEGAIASFSDGADAPVKSLVVGIEPVQSGTGDPSPDNVRPITGFTGAKIHKSGNLLPPHPDTVIESYGITFTNNNGKYTVNGIATTRASCDIPITLPAGEYTFAGFNHIGQTMNVYVLHGYQNVLVNIALSNDNTVTHFTLEEPATIVRFTIARDLMVNNGTANLMIVSGSETPTAWAPYSGDTLDISFPTEAGTVYGGTLDVTNGVLTVDMTIADMGTLNWIYYPNQQRIAAQVNSGKPAGANVGLDGACSVYKVVNAGYHNMPDKSVIIGNNFVSNAYAAMVVFDSAYTDAETFKTAVSGQMLVFPIKNPIVYQLTPTEVKSLLGQNNIWADTGDCSVEYRADTKLYIERLTEPDADMIADANIVSGQYFMVGNNLYKATANIASGGQAIVGTNCTQKSLSEALNEINQ